MMTTVAQRLSVRYVPMVAVAGAIFFSGIVFREHLPQRVPVALAVGGLVLGHRDDLFVDRRIDGSKIAGGANIPSA